MSRSRFHRIHQLTGPHAVISALFGQCHCRKAVASLATSSEAAVWQSCSCAEARNVCHSGRKQPSCGFSNAQGNRYGKSQQHTSTVDEATPHRHVLQPTRLHRQPQWQPQSRTCCHQSSNSSTRTTAPKHLLVLAGRHMSAKQGSCRPSPVSCWPAVSKRLLGRGSYVLIFNSEEQLFVSARSLSKDCYPGCLDVTVSGVVNWVSFTAWLALGLLGESCSMLSCALGARVGCSVADSFGKRGTTSASTLQQALPFGRAPEWPAPSAVLLSCECVCWAMTTALHKQHTGGPVLHKHQILSMLNTPPNHHSQPL